MCLKPTYKAVRISDIPYKWLQENNVKGLFLDIDNTLTSYHSEDIPDDILNWIHALIETGIKFVPYSNARVYRIQSFCNRFNIANPGMALKPLNFGLKRALKILGLKRSEVILIGDQIFTDCLAGKFAGIRTVLVDPVSTSEFPMTRIMRKIEILCGRQNWHYDKFVSE